LLASGASAKVHEVLARRGEPTEEGIHAFCEEKRARILARSPTRSPGKAFVCDEEGHITHKPSARSILGESGALGLSSYLDLHPLSPQRIQEEMRSLSLLGGHFDVKSEVLEEEV